MDSESGRPRRQNTINQGWSRISKEIEIQKIDSSTRDKARLMYFGDYQLIDIAEVMGVDLDTLSFYVFGEDGTGRNQKCWYKLKQELNPTSVAIYIKDKVKALEKTAGIAHNILAKSLLDLSQAVEDGKVLSIVDMKDLAGIISSMDKIVRLETGKPTEVHEFVSLSVHEAKQVLANDPFFQAEYKIVNEKEDELDGDVQVKSPWSFDE